MKPTKVKSTAKHGAKPSTQAAKPAGGASKPAQKPVQAQSGGRKS